MALYEKHVSFEDDEVRNFARLMFVAALIVLDALGDEGSEKETEQDQQGRLFEQEQEPPAIIARDSDIVRYETCKAWAFDALTHSARYQACAVAFHARNQQTDAAREALERMCGGEDVKRYIMSNRAGYVARAIAALYPETAKYLRIKAAPEGKRDLFAAVPWTEAELEEIRAALESC